MISAHYKGVFGKKSLLYTNKNLMKWVEHTYHAAQDGGHGAVVGEKIEGGQTQMETRQGNNTMTGKKIRPIEVAKEEESDVGARGLTDAVQSVDSDGLEGPPHHGVLLQHLVEVVNGEGEEAAVGVGPHTGCSPAFGQQADLCCRRRGGGRIERRE